MSTDHFDNEESLWDQLPNTEGRERAHLLLHIAGHRFSEDDFPTGLTLALESASIYESLGDHRGHGLALEEVARGQNGTCAHGEAVATLNQGIDLLKEHGEPGDLVDLYTGLGHIHRQQRKFEESADAFYAAYSVVRDEAAPTQDALALTAEAMGSALDALGGANELVITYFHEALAHGRGDASSHWMARVGRSMSSALRRQGKDERARQILVDDLVVARHCECGHCLPEALYALAYFDAYAGDEDGAMAGFTEAAAAAKRYKDGKPTVFDGNLHLFQSTVASDYAVALDHINQAEALYSSLARDWDVANCVDYRGMLAERAGDLDTALRHYVALQTTLVDLGDDSDMADLVYKIARIHVARGDANAALTVLLGGGYAEEEVDEIEDRDVARHCALFAKAKAAHGETVDALHYVEQLLHALSEHKWYEVHAELHETRARLLMHSDPAGSERAAQRAQACYNQAGDHEAATAIGYEFFIEPYELLTRIDVDNQMRAEAMDAERRVRSDETSRWEQDFVARSSMPDPIDSQVDRPDSGESAANTA